MAGRVSLPGSGRSSASGATRLKDVDASERLQVTVTLAGPPLPEPQPGAPLSRERLAREYGVDPQTLRTVLDVFQRLGLQVERSAAITRSVRLSGTVAQLEQAFGTRLGWFENARSGRFIGYEGALAVPAELDGLVTGVFGLDRRRVARRSRSVGRSETPGRTAVAAGQATAPLAPAQLTAHYRFPPGDGAGQSVAVGEFGGGFFASDLDAFCAQQQTPVPAVTPVSVNGAPILTLAQIQQLPAAQRQQQLDDSVEVNLDVQILAGLTPGVQILAYFSTFDEQGWVELINQVVEGTPQPVVALSLSWGLAEDDPDWSAGAVQAIDERLAAAAALGVTVCAAAGDDGSADQESDGRAHVDFPASSPHVLAVGGTMLQGDAEVVWWQAPGERTPSGGGASGGGVSAVFPRPTWQTVDIVSINPGSIVGRVVPDIAALAGPPFYQLVFMGASAANGGTSAATPLWASLVVLIAATGDWQPGFLAPQLYAPARAGATVGAAGCVDVTSGDNTSSTLGRGYSAGPGYDAVSGWGVPDGQALETLLAALHPASAG